MRVQVRLGVVHSHLTVICDIISQLVTAISCSPVQMKMVQMFFTVSSLHYPPPPLFADGGSQMMFFSGFAFALTPPPPLRMVWSTKYRVDGVATESCAPPL